MNKMNKEAVFGDLKNFLKSKGVQLEEGTYTQKIRKGCEILTDSVNLSQRALEQAKAGMSKGLKQLRQAVHERTAPTASRTAKNSTTASRVVRRKSKVAPQKKTVARNRRARS